MTTKEDVIACIRECAQKLGHSPSYPEVKRMYEQVSLVSIRKHFATFTRALRESGIEPRGGGHTISTEHLFRDWAGIARSLGRLPSVSDYEVNGKYSPRPLLRRFGIWSQVPPGLREFAERNGLAEEWADVLTMITEQQKEQVSMKRRLRPKLPEPKVELAKPKVMEDRPVYGPPLSPAGMSHGPVNESGVIYLFGLLANKLGFVVTRIQAEFPDCEALREVEPGRWQRVRIEFEFESRRFAAHKHGASDCDIIVCWLHNWAECPEHLEVIELRTLCMGF